MGNTNAPTFHLFSDLPAELRTMIWEMAVRRADRPGIHYFSQADVETPGKKLPFRALEAKHHHVPADEISFPSNGNISTYLLDGGMWTAAVDCQYDQSHQCLLPYRKTGLGTGYRCDSRSNPTLRAQFSRGSELQQMVLYLEADLVHVSHSFTSTLQLDRLRCGPRAPLHSLVHAAFDYNPEWDNADNMSKEDLVATGLDWLVRNAEDLTYQCEKLWFIDYRIRMGPDEADTARDPMFYGEGFRLVNIWPIRGYARPVGTEDWTESMTGEAANDFINTLSRQITKHFIPGVEFTNTRHGLSPELGILARVYDA